MNPKCVLLIDDDPALRSLVQIILQNKGYKVITAKDGMEGLDIFKLQKIDIVLTDYQMPGLSGIEVLIKIKELDSMMPVIVLTAHGDATLAIKSMQKGAFDFIEKPINPKELIEVVNIGLKTAESLRQADDKQVQQEFLSNTNLMVGKNPAMLNIFKNIGRISQNNIYILISGENGTGKKQLARLVHQSAYNRDQALVYINCKTFYPVIPAGEFANKNTKQPDQQNHESIISKINEAKSGTIVLDGINLLSTEMQRRLLAIMNQFGYDAGEVNKSHPRFISIETKDTLSMVQEGNFLKELYYKLRVFYISMPPLRQRKDDIPLLIKNLIEEMNPVLNKKISTIEDGLIKLLQSYDWPGNTSEFKNVLMQAMVLCSGAVLEKKHIYIEGISREPETIPDTWQNVIPSLAEIEKEHILRVLQHTKGNKQETSLILGITRPTLNAKIEKYGLSVY